MRFFTRYPKYRYTETNRPKKLDDYREFLINFMNFIFDRIVASYFQKYDTERHATNASVPEETDFYRQMKRLRDNFIDRVKFDSPTYSDLRVLIEETILEHQEVFYRLTYNQIIAGELRKYALPNMEIHKDNFTKPNLPRPHL